MAASLRFRFELGSAMAYCAAVLFDADRQSWEPLGADFADILLCVVVRLFRKVLRALQSFRDDTVRLCRRVGLYA